MRDERRELGLVCFCRNQVQFLLELVRDGNSEEAVDNDASADVEASAR